MIVVHILAAVGGIILVGVTLMSAVRTFVLPRGEATLLTRSVFISVRGIFHMRLHFAKTYEERDRIFAPFAPVTLLLLPFVWLVLVGIGYTAIFWATGGVGWSTAARASGSSLFTLGYIELGGVADHVVQFSEAGLGLGLLALLISYLPSMYSAFQRREAAVALLEARAGSPPSARNALLRYQRIQGLDQIDEIWPQWEQWFADVEESHTSLGAMTFFRSPHPERSWITAAGAVLDTASLICSTIDRARTPPAEICIRSGFLCLRRICDFFGMPYDPDPKSDDPISVSREEYDAVCAELEAEGVPLKADREEAWRSFQGWRVNYDAVLLMLAGLVMAPPAPWSGDRATAYRRPRLAVRGRSLHRPHD